MLYLSVFFACTQQPPAVSSVSPSEGRPGDTITVAGQHFDEQASAMLGGQPVAGLKHTSETALSGQVPSGLAPGPHDLLVTNPDGQKVTVPSAFTVAKPAPIEVCGKKTPFGAAKVDAGRKVVQTFRYTKGRGEEPDVTEIKWRDIDKVEYEGHATEDGKYCSAVIIRSTDGSRHVFEESRTAVLKDKAQHVAGVLSKGVDIVHEDPQPTAE